MRVAAPNSSGAHDGGGVGNVKTRTLCEHHKESAPASSESGLEGPPSANENPARYHPSELRSIVGNEDTKGCAPRRSNIFRGGSAAQERNPRNQDKDKQDEQP